jgi:hypothetical protein
MIDFVYSSILPYWSSKEVSLKHLSLIYRQSIYLRNASEYEQESPQEKGRLLQKIADVNLGEGEECLQTHLKFSRKWDNKAKLYILKPSEKILQ